MTPRIGTLIRCSNLDDRRLDFLASAGMTELQIAGLSGEWLDNPAKSAAAFDQMHRHSFAVNTMFLSIPDIDWSDPGDIGLIPEAKRPARTALLKRQLDAAAAHGVRSALCHAGKIPPFSDKQYAPVLDTLKDLADHASQLGMTFVFESGQENAEAMSRVLADLGRSNAGINLDPANLLIYGSDEPAHFLRALKPHIFSMHCKDARHARAGEKSGRETVLGAGETHFAELLGELVSGGFNGPLIVERELQPGPEQEKNLKNAVQFIKNILGEYK